MEQIIFWAGFFCSSSLLWWEDWCKPQSEQNALSWIITWFLAKWKDARGAAIELIVQPITDPLLQEHASPTQQGQKQVSSHPHHVFCFFILFPISPFGMPFLSMNLSATLLLSAGRGDREVARKANYISAISSTNLWLMKQRLTNRSRLSLPAEAGYVIPGPFFCSLPKQG